VWRRAVLLVADELTEPWRALAALDDVGRMGPDRVVVATPVASAAALAVLRSANVESIVLRTAWARLEPSAAYRSFGEPADRVVRDRMLRPAAAKR
jgi:predicted phosphoribosyltransferase